MKRMVKSSTDGFNRNVDSKNFDSAFVNVGYYLGEMRRIATLYDMQEDVDIVDSIMEKMSNMINPVDGDEL